jgi:rRNA-processing protein FCF1
MHVYDQKFGVVEQMSEEIWRAVMEVLGVLGNTPTTTETPNTQLESWKEAAKANQAVSLRLERAQRCEFLHKKKQIQDGQSVDCNWLRP